MTITESFEIYCENIKKQQELDESLFSIENKALWQQNLMERAKKMRDINRCNSEILDDLRRTVLTGLSPEIASELKQAAILTIIQGMSDAALQYPALMALAEYYKEMGEISSYIQCVFFAGFVEGEILYRSGAMESVSTHPDELVVAERAHYAEIEDPEIRAYFLMSYHNLAVCSVTKHEDIPQSYEYLMAMEEFWNSPAVQELDGENSEFITYMENTRRIWLQLSFEKGDLGTPACEYYCAYAKKLFDEMEKATGGDVDKYLIQTYGPYLNSRVILGEMSYAEAAEKFYVKYRSYMDMALSGRSDMAFICFGLIPTLNILTELADKTDDETKKHYYTIINGDLARFGKGHHAETQVDSNINQVLAEMCVKSISVMNGREEKEKMLFNLVIKRQLLTYIHSMMTTRISLLVAESAWDALPGYFAETGFKDKNELLKYVESAARLHDLGKIHITDIVNMQRRRLDEEEFHGIRRHPTLGAKIVENDKDLNIYRDVILGHHRFYDGKGGYPMDFDNTTSRFRKIIDIVTIADCLDAATDCYSRNYKTPKSFLELLEELKQGAGNRYNPELVNAIGSDKRLCEKLTKVVNEERMDMMFEAYRAGREMYI